jgi:hypothetical protein
MRSDGGVDGRERAGFGVGRGGKKRSGGRIVVVSVALNLFSVLLVPSQPAWSCSESISEPTPTPTQAAPACLWALPRCLLSSEQNREPTRGCPFALHAVMDGIKSVV